MVVDPIEAKYVLLSMHQKDKKIIKDKSGSFTQLGLQQQVILHNGISINTHVVRVDELNCYYVDLRHADGVSGHITRQLGATLCGNMRHLFSNDGSNVYDELTKNKDIIKRKKTLKKLRYKYNISNKKIQKISQYHHMHVRLKDLYANKEIVDVDGYEAYLVYMLDKFTDNAITHATFITYLRALPEPELELFVSLLVMYETIDADWLKEEGAVAKQAQGSTSLDLSKIFELNVLLNRLETAVDWDAEKDHRTNLNVVNINDDDIYNICRDMFEIARQEGKRPIKMDWNKYWMQRASIMPSGAVHSQHPQIQEYIKRLPREAKNKKGLACALPHIDLTDMLVQPPEIQAYTSTKYEWGKVRALYGCDFNSHVMADFGLLNCEDTFPHFVPTGPHANEKYVRNLLKQVENDVPFCFDYDDFNSQHSKKAMQAVIDAWISVYEDDIDDAQVLAAIWTSRSVNDMTVNDNIGKTTYTAEGTLFSGWRLTTFVNTALNYAYLAKSGINKLCNMSIHNGDDVYAGVRNLQDAIKIIKATKQYNIRANTTKMSMGTIAEFLRVDMRSKSSTSAQYLTRGTATFVHGRIESESPLSYRALINSYKTRYDEMLQRGALPNKIKHLYRKQLFFANKLFDVNKETSDLLLKTHVAAGGLDPNGIIGNYELVDTAMPNTTINYNEILNIVKPGIRDYVTSLSSLYPEIREYISYNQSSKNIMKGFNTSKQIVTKREASSLHIRNAIALKGAWANDKSFRIYNRVRMGVSNTIGVLGKLSNAQAKILSDTHNPQKWLSIYTVE